jgi:hypothetical protein
MNDSFATLTLVEDAMTRRPIVAMFALLCTVAAAHVQADARVTVHDFYGPSAGRLRDDVVNLLERQSGVTIVSKVQIDSMAMQLGVDPFSAAGRMALARELRLSAWMSGVVSKRAGGLTLTVAVHDGAQNSLVGRAFIHGSSAKKLSMAIRQNLWRKSRPAILQAMPPSSADAAKILDMTEPSAEPAAVGGDDDAAQKAAGTDAAVAAEAAAGAAALATEGSHPAQDAARAQARDDGAPPKPPSEAVRGDTRGEALRAFIGLASPYRSLTYREPVTASLVDYQLSGAPLLDINLAMQPARPFTDNWISWIGLDMGAQIAASTPSFEHDGARFKSRYDAYHVGLRGRIPLGQHYVSLFTGYAMTRFAVSAETKGATTPTPSVDYRTIRSGVGGEFALSDALLLGLDVAWLQSLSAGQIAQWFPRSTSAGVELALIGTYRVTQLIFARAAASYQRTFFDFNARQGDARVAGGAIDQYLAFAIGAGVCL